MCLHTAIYVSASSYICVLILLYVSSYSYMCLHNPQLWFNGWRTTEVLACKCISLWLHTRFTPFFFFGGSQYYIRTDPTPLRPSD
jgi:hypothetical protein